MGAFKIRTKAGPQVDDTSICNHISHKGLWNLHWGLQWWLGAHDWHQNLEVAGKNLTEWGDHFMARNFRRSIQSLDGSGEKLRESDLKNCS